MVRLSRSIPMVRSRHISYFLYSNNNNITDIFRSGIVLTTVCALLAVISLVSLLLHISTLSLSSSPRALRIQSLSLLFTTTWLFATLVPFDKFARQGSAHVVARLGNLVLPATFVQAEEAEIGVSPLYWSLKFSTRYFFFLFFILFILFYLYHDIGLDSNFSPLRCDNPVVHISVRRDRRCRVVGGGKARFVRSPRCCSRCRHDRLCGCPAGEAGCLGCHAVIGFVVVMSSD